MKIPPIVYILLVVLLAGGGYYLYSNKLGPFAPAGEEQLTSAPTTQTRPSDGGPAPTADPSAQSGTLHIDGSTSMVVINKALSIGYQQQVPEVEVSYKANGTSQGIAALLAGQAEIAAASRPLKPEEAQRGLKAVPVAVDEIAVVVGVKNPFQGSLSTGQLADIFAGRTTNWSQLGGANRPLKVINRNPDSGTYEFFQKVVLGGAPFGTGSNVTTLSRDETTPLLRALGSDGIGYATVSQVRRQKTVRIVAINDQLPGTDNEDYPLRRNLYYVYKDPPSPLIKAFIDYALTSDAKSAIRRYGF
ncbi:phosphate ABC transporter substrate-binding protein [Gloeobacter kilaueensis]|uniref:Phosphate binding protein n=1 Tax=Gloeobacter kilaueensis (strain ATCC BAA-2537 / CCAP 1431/1 / ULC 316 / JS1) TaxID=1183438 RepID=U5QG44_GLOK1|nr:phosphate ABC transporter substrate-binding protein [Gloeobacter kilaueensis]AGY56614.1 phosphate binding protein [Gloeobacter kilaueensis JS1]